MKNISNSKLDLYEQCARKFKFRYIDNLKGDYTSSALLFGTALDSALNYILESLRDKQEWKIGNAKDIFVSKMQEWDGQNRLDFFKGDVPESLIESYDEGDIEHQEQVWENLVNRGLACIDVYTQEVLPQFKEILSVQNKLEIQNEDGDTFVGVVDFIAKLQDDTVVLFDNKSSSAKYPKNKVVKSQQLSLYLEQFPEIKHAGYVVLLKNPAKEKGLTHQIMYDKIPEETTADAYNRLETALSNIKAEKFEPNFKSCRKFNKPCEYSQLCQYGDKSGLIPAYEKKTAKTQDPSHGDKSNPEQA